MDDNSKKTPNDPFNGRAEWIAQERNWPIDKARNYVVVEGLRTGDPLPLVQFVREGHLITKFVMVLIAEMLDPIKGSESLSPFRLEIRPRGKVRRQQLWRKERDRLIVENFVRGLTEWGRGSYQGVCERISSAMSVGKETIRKAYDNRLR